MRFTVVHKTQLAVTENGDVLDVFDTDGMTRCDVSDGGKRRPASDSERVCYQRPVQSGTLVGAHAPARHRLGDLRLLWYPKGGHMLRHADRQVSARHAGTLVAIPPQTCEGGELVVSKGRTVLRRVPCHATKWTVVTLPIGTYHEVTPVASEGGRSVVTAPIFTVPAASTSGRRPRRPRATRRWPRAPGVRD